MRRERRRTFVPWAWFGCWTAAKDLRDDRTPFIGVNFEKLESHSALPYQYLVQYSSTVPVVEPGQGDSLRGTLHQVHNLSIYLFTKGSENTEILWGERLPNY